MDKPGEPYQPSNGIEGMAFMDDFCDQCSRDEKYKETQAAEDGCGILVRTLVLSIGDPGYPTEWIYDGDGRPTCTAFITDDLEIRLDHKEKEQH